MTQIHYDVSIPPNEVMQRLGWVVETSGVRGVVGSPGAKRFIGNLTGNQFSFRRWRWTSNTLASRCSGKVEPAGSGSVITVNIGAKYGCFLAFAIVFVVMATLIPAGLIGMIHLATMSTPPTPETAHLLRQYWIGVGVIPLGVAAFFAAFFFLGRVLTRPDEKEMTALFPSLFSDAMRPPPPGVQ
jgi:hypothetical protein